ncbi:Lar family restriction alleviation protein [Pseudomonas aeruginosa]|uniref:Lar family restriction alleviation protein n=1 Tax=Pseudomonas aeruginosa TaxID=287 RepID=UPI0022AF80F9|nr:Lar family restriction alleviation protein [Pseudomonas aeruginosa]WAW38802.1 Lar family restriction alleviation protein [Pseudomonas aeruginosa]
MAEELKPCPFCGETPSEDSYAHADGGYKYGAISCSCGVIGPDVRTGYKKWPEWRDSAVTAWNERAVPAGHVVVSEGLLRKLMELIEHGDFSEGHCMCGSPVDSHGIGDGHTPIDAGEYYAGQVMEELRALLSEQEGGKP